jgi:formylglycine-generating enzyme required for sulfatase activity
VLLPGRLGGLHHERDEHRPGGNGGKWGGLWGQLDLAGNLAQWNLDWYASGYVNPCADCAQLLPSSDRVVRGGSFLSTLSSEWLPPDRRFGSLPTGGTPGVPDLGAEVPFSTMTPTWF